MAPAGRTGEGPDPAGLPRRAFDFIFGNLRDKVFALLAAFTIYVYVSQETSTSSGVLQVPVEVVPPAGVMYTILKPGPQVRLELVGPAREMDRVLAAARQVVRVKLEVAGTGEREVPLASSDFRLDPGNTPVSAGISVRYRPGYESILVLLQEAQEGWLPVDVVHDGDLAEGTRVRSMGSQPSHVRLRAPRDFFRNPGRVPTVLIPLARRGAGDYTVPVALDRTPGGRAVQLDGADEVMVHLAIEPVPARRALTGVPVYLLQRPDLPYRFRLSVETTCDVVVEGPQLLVAGVDAARLKALVDPEREWGPEPVPQDLSPFHVEGLPAGVQWVEASEVSVKAEPR
ncbi:MAG: hypothetical protein HY722_11830 [Planctomycetes bacterium]|nr:hypothetical protein [Planctomycetota bacterium]